MKRIRLQTKDGNVVYGKPYPDNCEYNPRKYILNNKLYSMQDINEIMTAINDNGLGILDVISWEIERVDGVPKEDNVWAKILK